MVASVQALSPEKDTKSKDILSNQSQGLEEEEPRITQDEAIAELPESQVPFNLANVPLEENAQTTEAEKTEEPQAEETKSLGGPPQVQIEELEEIPEALPVPEPPISTENSAALIDSLNGLSATSFVSGMKQVSNVVNTVQNQEQTTLSEALPEIEQPTGLPTKGSSELAEYVPKKGKTPDLKTKEKGKKQEVPVEHKSDLAPIPQQVAPKIALPNAQEEEEESGSWWSRMFSFVSANINSIKTTDGGVNTSAGPRPKIDTSGEANTQQNEQNQTAANSTVLAEQQKADLNTTEYRGEQEIYPEIERETLRPNIELTAIQEREVKPAEDLVLTQEVRDKIDIEAQTKMEAEVQPEIDKNATEYQTYQDKAVEEKELTNTQIEEETANAKTEQEQKQTEAKDEVTTERANWKQENEAVKKGYEGKSEEEKKKVDGDIDKKIRDSDAEVENKYGKAEKDADAKKDKAEKDAKTEKKKAEEKEEDRGFWGSITDAIGDFFDAIREAVNAIFDALREGVKLLIEAAKKAVNTLIDLARDAIVGFIKAFGEALKVLVSIALVAFPDLRNKALAAIDKAVEVAVTVVNTIAEGLKKIANALLDALGAVLDAILAVYQAIMNAVLDVLEFITVGLIKILEGLTNLGFAAAEMPSQFWGQISEEFLGMDVTKPLPFEIIGTAKNDVEELVNVSEAADVDDFLSKDTYSEDDFKVEHVPTDMELSSELMTSITQLDEGQEFSFGENNENTMDGLLGEIKQENSADNTNPLKTNKNESEQATAMPPELVGDPYAQVDWFINYQNSQTSQGKIPDTADPSQVASSESLPSQMRMIGPLTVGARLHYLKEQMMAGITKKWNENKWTYIGIGAAVLLAITALAIATAGAIFGLIPPALTIFAAIMGGMAVLKAASFFGDYIKEGWVGNLIKGGMNLARSIGILLVELIFILLFDLNTLLKVLKSGVKGTLKMAAAGAKNTFKALGTGLKATGKGLAKNGRKVVTAFKGVGKGMGKGAKNFDDFAKRLFKRFKFKGFKIQRRGLRFNLLGNINPWILLASGELKEVKKKGGVEIGGSGKFITKEGDEVIEGILVGIGGKKTSSFVDDIVKNQDDAFIYGKSVYDDIVKHGSETARKEFIQGAKSFDYDSFMKEFGKRAADAHKTRGALAKNIGKAPSKLHQAHHLIPVELIAKSKILRKAIEAGFEFNGKINGKWVKQFSSKIDELADGIHASHPKYTDNVLKKINNDIIDYMKDLGKSKVDDLSKSEIREFMDLTAIDLGNVIDANIKSDLPVKINKLIF